MADPIKAAVLKMNCRLREYCPVGELLPGMAYLVRRLLENTSNEGFLANKFAKDASRDDLLKNPFDLAADVRRLYSSSSHTPHVTLATHYTFLNEPHTD